MTVSRLLLGRRVLVVEDDYFIADEICRTLRDHGAEIVGPAPSLGAGLVLARDGFCDCAVLDINLKGEPVYELARELLRQGTPAIFATGYAESALPIELRSSTRLQKPLNLVSLVEAIQVAAAYRHAARSTPPRPH